VGQPHHDMASIDKGRGILLLSDQRKSPRALHGVGIARGVALYQTSQHRSRYCGHAMLISILGVKPNNANCRTATPNDCHHSAALQKVLVELFNIGVF